MSWCHDMMSWCRIRILPKYIFILTLFCAKISFYAERPRLQSSLLWLYIYFDTPLLWYHIKMSLSVIMWSSIWCHNMMSWVVDWDVQASGFALSFLAKGEVVIPLADQLRVADRAWGGGSTSHLDLNIFLFPTIFPKATKSHQKLWYDNTYKTFSRQNLYNNDDVIIRKSYSDETRIGIQAKRYGTAQYQRKTTPRWRSELHRICQCQISRSNRFISDTSALLFDSYKPHE